MSDSPAVYSIVSWVRRGLASLVTGQPVTNYAALPVSISVNGTAANAPAIRLLGPGDITALDARAIIRAEPRNLSDNFEPNYLAAVELALPDLPWMFTPSGDVNGRLRPWICLVVVPDAPGATIESRAGGISVLRLDSPLDPKSELPDLNTIDLWAHAQITGDSLTGTALNKAFDADPSATLSRLIAPRRLDPGQGYIACIVPTYRAGVNAALGLTVDDHDVAPAWDASVTAPFTLPVYYYFRFRTGPGGDFASLAEKIRPPAGKPTVGTRTMDVSTPGFGVPPFSGMTMELGGALQKIDAQPNNSQTPSPAQTAYANALPSVLVPHMPPGADPTVAPPTYGSAQAGVSLPAMGTPPLWLRDLNLDPRTRAAASAGTQVVQENQEALVASSWDQVGELTKANRLLRQAQLARQITSSLNTRHLQTVNGEGVFLQMTSPLQGRVALNGNATLRSNVAASRLPASAVSGSLRKFARPKGPVGRQVTTGKPAIVERLNGNLQAAAAVSPPRGMVAFDDVALKSPVASAAGDIRIAKMTTVLSSAGWKLAAVSADRSASLQTAKTTLSVTSPAISIPTAPVTLPTGTVSLPTGTVNPTASAAQFMDWSANVNLPEILKTNQTNLPAPFAISSNQASLAHDQFVTASAAANSSLQIAPVTEAVAPPLGGTGASPLLAIRTQVGVRIDPEKTIPARVGARIPLGAGADILQPIRTGPEFPTPMYTALADLSPEWMLPGISAIPIDCAALLAPNPQFIESYMLGLNEALSRELLWRQFPADPRKTYFQHFWGASDPDIPQITAFNGNGKLGSHVTDRSTGNSVVLLIRANLFRRYPNAVVSAIPAVWIDKNPGPGKIRALNPNAVRTFPVFRGEIGADVTFFGFEISDPRGMDDPSASKPGYYFVIEEHLTEPRFGLEPVKPVNPTVPTSWNDLSWPDVSAGTFLTPASLSAGASTAEQVTWAANAASMAFILMRKPVRVAMHAIALMGPS